MITRKNSRSRMAIAAAACVAAVASTSAHADALAQSLLDITDFTISFTAGEITPQGTPTATVQSSATFNNLPGTPVLAGLQSVTSVGPNAALYTAGTAMTPYPGVVLPGNLAGGFAEQTGNAIAGGADAHSDATVSIVPQGAPLNGSQGSNTVGQEFLVNVAGPGSAAVSLSFDADAFLRAYLTSGPFFDFQSGGANASTTWRLEVFRVVSSTSQPRVAVWQPGGDEFGDPGWSCNAAFVTGCTETAPFQLNQNIVAFSDDDDLSFDNSGSFIGNLSLLGTNTYRFSINHTSIANANLNLRAIPEPGSLALAGLALLAAGVSARRRLG